MKKQLIGAAGIALMLVFAQPARAELLHVEIKTLGMD
jgi:hypothetical protein